MEKISTASKQRGGALGALNQSKDADSHLNWGELRTSPFCSGTLCAGGWAGCPPSCP